LKGYCNVQTLFIRKKWWEWNLNIAGQWGRIWEMICFTAYISLVRTLIWIIGLYQYFWSVNESTYGSIYLIINGKSRRFEILRS
jgi:hypothetical protein